MDQDAFRETYREVNENFCAFEKSVLINQCNCSKAERFCIAEREGVHCLSEEGQARCLDALSILRDHATFALRELTEGKLPHGKAMRVQIGGMRGLNKLLNGDDTQVPDVDAILQAAIQRWGSLEQLPFSEIMPSIAAYKGKTRARRRQKD
ncbi:MAG: hypothetical protein ACO378_02295 [Sedimenticolaceae bacterium]|mgnify:CR=1 FL=1|jgi:hypothetical protein